MQTMTRPEIIQLKAQALLDSIPEKLDEAINATTAVTAQKKADQGILLCKQLTAAVQDLRAEFVKVRMERPVEPKPYE